MKKIFLIAAFLMSTMLVSAQLGGIINNAKKKTEEKVNKKVDDEIDKQTDGKNQAPADDSKTTEQKSADTTAAKSSTNAAPAPLKVYSKYDFVPGNFIVNFEDFAQDQVGDFPAKWNTNAAGEVVTVEGKQGHWLMLTQHGFFVPEFIDSFPDNFTLEFDMLCDQLVGSWGLQTSIAQLKDRTNPDDWQSAPNRFTLEILPGGEDANGSCSYDRRKNDVGEAAISTPITTFKDASKPVHVAMWRQNERLRVYLNEQKVWDVPKAFLTNVKYNSLVYAVQLIDGQKHFMLTNIRLAVGAPDTRSKFITEGKWVTHGILFDVNSANIKPESYGTIKQMADVLKENADVKVKIIGYTDSDGDEAKNLDLSKRRAAAVKDVLANEFSIDPSRMETDGKGEASPIDTNNTPEGKANNRRVEFVKM